MNLKLICFSAFFIIVKLATEFVDPNPPAVAITDISHENIQVKTKDLVDKQNNSKINKTDYGDGIPSHEPAHIMTKNDAKPKSDENKASFLDASFSVFDDLTPVSVHPPLPPQTSPKTTTVLDTFILDRTRHVAVVPSTHASSYVPLEISPTYPHQDFSFSLDTFQRLALSSLLRDESVLVSAHTSSGKTVVAEYAISLSLSNNQRCIYTSPIKALSNQKYRDLCKIHGNSNVGIITGDSTTNPNASILVMTTEIMRNMLYKGSVILKEVRYVIFDEIHYLKERERGVIWEECIILSPPHFRFVFLSATVPNSVEFVEWVVEVVGNVVHVVFTEKRPTPLEHYLYVKGGNGMTKVLYNKNSGENTDLVNVIGKNENKFNVMNKDLMENVCLKNNRNNDSQKNNNKDGDNDKITRINNDNDKKTRINNDNDKITRINNEGIVRINNDSDKITRINNDSDKKTGVNKDGDKITRINNDSDKITRINNDNDKITRINNDNDKITGVNNDSDKITRINNDSDKITRINNDSDKITGVNNDSDKKTGVNNDSIVRIDNDDKNTIRSNNDISEISAKKFKSLSEDNEIKSINEKDITCIELLGSDFDESQWNKVKTTYFDKENFLSAMKMLRGRGKIDDFDVKQVISLMIEEKLLPTIVFSFARKECERYALSIDSDFLTPEEKERSTLLFNDCIKNLREEDRTLPLIQNIIPILSRGIGIHHAGLLPIIKETVELLFQEGLIKILFATETFSIGLNMPAKSVVFTNLTKFDGEKRRVLSSGEYIQMSGRAGRRGIDLKGVVVAMTCEIIPMKKAVHLFSGLADRLESAFRLTYNMILNLMRVEGLDTVYLMERSFFHYQSKRGREKLDKKIKKMKFVIDKIHKNNDPKDKLIFTDYFLNSDDSVDLKIISPDLKISLSSLNIKLLSPIQIYNILLGYEKIRCKRNILRNKDVKKYLEQGRIIDIFIPNNGNSILLKNCLVKHCSKKDIMVNYSLSDFNNNIHTKRFSLDFIDSVYDLRVKNMQSLTRTTKGKIEKIELSNEECKEEIDFLNDIISIIHINVFDYLMKDWCYFCGNKIENECIEYKCIDNDQIEESLMNSCEFIDQETNSIGNDIKGNCDNVNYNINDKRNCVMKYNNYNANYTINGKEKYNINDKRNFDTSKYKGYANNINGKSNLNDRYLKNMKNCKELSLKIRSTFIEQKFKEIYDQTKRQLNELNKIYHLDECKKMIQVLRRLEYCDNTGVLVKGRVACELSTADELILTEMMFNGEFTGMPVEEIVPLLSCLIFPEWDNDGATLSENNKKNYGILISTIDKISSVMNECGMDICKQTYLKRFSHELMDIIEMWVKGYSFVEICAKTTVFEGSIIRALRRLEELMKQMGNAAREIGNNELENIFAIGIGKIKRDIVFAVSLYI